MERYRVRDDADGYQIGGGIEPAEMVLYADCIAALAQARREALEECAAIADGMVAPLRPNSTNEHLASHTTAYKIAVAIRDIASAT